MRSREGWLRYASGAAAMAATTGLLAVFATPKGAAAAMGPKDCAKLRSEYNKFQCATSYSASRCPALRDLLARYSCN